MHYGLCKECGDFYRISAIPEMRCESNEGGETGRKRGKRFQRMNASTHFLVVFMETTRKLINRMYATPFVCLFASRSVSPSLVNG